MLFKAPHPPTLRLTAKIPATANDVQNPRSIVAIACSPPMSLNLLKQFKPFALRDISYKQSSQFDYNIQQIGVEQ
ncbi:MAG: hypothetical protein A0129_11195 [Limnobacter sp. CACIAM 66H1]|nr:MAG: hypothetical protein A0129_11195 [Limnobacter sp. CACIAM 66H1]